MVWFPSGMTDQEYMQQERRAIALSSVFKVLILLMAIVAVFEGEWVWVFSGLFAAVFTFVPSLLERNLRITLPWALEFLIFLALALHVVGGVLDLYDRFPNWDTMTHLVSTFMLATVSLTVIYLMHVYWDGITMDLKAIMFFTVVFAMALGVMWEIIEWTSDVVFGTQEQHGLDDTMMDMVMDTIGGMIAALLGARAIKNGTLLRMTADFGRQIEAEILRKVPVEIPEVGERKRRKAQPDECKEGEQG